jgi:acetyl esterase/lipase
MDILSLPVLRPDYRVAYGPAPSQFGDLWIPDDHGHAPHPVVVFFHGGWWKSEYDLGYAGHLCAALKRAGIATWSVEYRRLGITGGGWPMTFQDAAAGFDYLSKLAADYPLDLSRVVAVGHSAGGHLAFWNAGRHHIPLDSELFLPSREVSVRGVIALAGAVDLRLVINLSGNWTFAHDRAEVYALMGGSPSDWPGRYQAGNPGDLLPFQVPQLLIQGADDDQIPPGLPLRWVTMSRHLGSHATLQMIPNADHFDLVDPASKAWETVLSNINSMLYL